MLWPELALAVRLAGNTSILPANLPTKFVSSLPARVWQDLTINVVFSASWPFQRVSVQSTARWGTLLAQNKFVSINQHVNEHTPHPAFTAPVKGLFYYFHKWYSAVFECTKRGMLCKNVNFDTDLLSPPSVLHVLSSESAFFRRPARTTPNALWLLAKTLPWGTPRAILPHLHLVRRRLCPPSSYEAARLHMEKPKP